jgi:hypothetical protein
VRGGALGAITVAAVYLYSAFAPEHSRWFNRVMFSLVTNLAFVPVLILAYRRLVRPAGMRFGESFGLVPVAGGVRSLGLVLLAPPLKQTTIARIELMPLGNDRTLAVAVTDAGWLTVREVTLDPPPGADETRALGRELSRRFGGRTVEERALEVLRPGVKETEVAAEMDAITPHLQLLKDMGSTHVVYADTSRGQVLFVAEDFDEEAEAGPVEFVSCADEVELLTAFWDVAKHYDRIVTFNGRGFDVPFIYLRSAILNVPISRKDWLGYRFQTDPHCDLAEQLTFYGVSGREGAARRFNLDFYCKAFRIESPKSHGVTGMDVNRLLAEGRHRDIAEYCLRDVQATVLLYQIWKERLIGIK